MASSHFQTSFSNAAAGKEPGVSNHAIGSSTAQSGQSQQSSSGANSADWTRRVNGTNSTSNRRPSLSTTLTHTSSTPLTSSSNVYHPPHHYNRQAAAASTTYGKDELISIFKVQDGSGLLSKKLPELLETELAGTGSGGWGRSGDEAINGVELCWEKDGGLKPVGLDEYTEEERELFSGNVNSPHKPTNNNAQNPPNVGASTQNRSKAPGIISTPGTNRPQTRRRETSDAAAGGNPFGGTPPQISRRRTDLRDEEASSPRSERTFFSRWGANAAGSGVDEESKDKDDAPGGTGGRNTGLFRRGSAAWGGSGGSGFGSGGSLNSPMGTFGNGTFGGGAMGGFIPKTTATSSTTTSGPKGGTSVSRPGVEEINEHTEEPDMPQAVSDVINELREENERDRPMTSDTDPFGIGGDRDEHGQNEHRDATALGIDQHRTNKTSLSFGGIGISASAAPRSAGLISTPTRTRPDFGFSAFGGSREGLGGTTMTGLQHQLQNLQFNNQGQVPLRRSREGSLGGALAGDHEPLSPAETNPFTSPPPEKSDDDGMAAETNEGGGLGSVIAGLRRGESGSVVQPGSDRSGRSSTAGLGSVGGMAGGFGGLGGAGLWNSGQIGTPGGVGGASTAQPSFFGGTPLGEFSSPGGASGSGSLLTGGLGGIGSLGGNTGFGSAGRASRLGQLFPEAQHLEEPQSYESDAFGADPRFNAFGSRRGLGGAIDSPMRERGDVADLFGFPNTRSLSNLAGAAAAQEPSLYRPDSQDPLGLGQTQNSPPNLQNPIQPGAPLRPPPGTVPPAQTHVMVMPDKINWEYRDPSGTIQGPFSGLEMHEWYRAGFFTQDLAVKRVEDTEFEQLGILVRKIGNTREPFLVPLPGTTSAAGMSTSATSTNWSEWGLNDIPGVPQSQTPGTMQPPFAGSFPTFGTTLTAEQQNALERRKQEEQYLMAKQREFLLQQQMMAKQAAVLHHQSSTKSLHSQTSFGSLHSPSGYAPATTPATAIVGGQNAFEPGVLLRQAGAAAGGSDAMNIGGPVSGMQTPGGQFPQQISQQQPTQQDQLLQMQQQQQRLVEQQRQQLQRSYQNQQTQHVEKQLQQAQEQAHQASGQIQQSTNYMDSKPSMESLREQEPAPPYQPQEQQQQSQQHQFEPEPVAMEKPETPTPTPVAEQLPKVNIPRAPSVKSSPAPKPTQPAWSQPAPFVQPFPPPPGQDQHGSVATSPTVETPSAASIAPWAKENEPAVKTPSLREIQELEAKQAAAREAAEAQARAQVLAQQTVTLNTSTPPAPGLPSTATWATSPSTTPAASGASAWNKPLQKANTRTSAAPKTLQQIQKEEEARKAKAAASLASQTTVISNPPLTVGGKRYADLAAKTTAAATAINTAVSNSGIWTTVGPGGKSKGGPVTPAPPTAPAAAIKPTMTAIKKPSSSPQLVTTSAQEEFLKWCRASIKGLNPGVTCEQVIETVSTFPAEHEIISDTIYSLSSTMDGRRWAEEYIKRRAAASNNVVIEAGTAGGSNGGWNEVAKKSVAIQQTQVEKGPETTAAFRVVNKKKGRRG